MHTVISHQEAGNLIRVHYTHADDKEGTDSGYLAYQRNDILMPKIGDGIELPQVAEDLPKPTTKVAEISNEVAIPVKPQYTITEETGKPDLIDSDKTPEVINA